MERNKQKSDLAGIATLSANPLATYHLVVDKRTSVQKQKATKKGGRK